MLGDIIYNLRKEAGFSQEYLGNLVNVSTSSIGMYEQNRRLPNIETLVSICDIFAVSSDYLLERSNNRSPYKKASKENELLISKRILELMEELDMDISSVSSTTKIQKQRLENILSEMKKPNIIEVISLAECFFETTDYILCLTDLRSTNIEQSPEWRFPPSSTRLGNILKKYRNKVNLSEQEISKKLNINTETYIGIEIGKYIPSMMILQKLSHVTGYDLDYLTGAIDHVSICSHDELFEIGGKKLPIFYSEDNYHFKSRFEELCYNKKIDQNNAQEQLGLTKQEFMDICWNRMPTLSELLKISYAFNVSMDYLIGKTDVRLSSLSDDELALIMNYRDCLPSYKKNILDRARDLSIESVEKKEITSVAADEKYIDNQGKSQPSSGTGGGTMAV